MNKRYSSDSKRTLIFILIPMLTTFLALRLYLHLVNPNADLYVAGYNVHHLFTGTLIEIGRGLYPPEKTRQVLESRDRKTAGKTADARGLKLVKVFYR